VDARLVIASKRDERRYADRPIPDDVVTWILDAGRLAGSAANRQRRRFVVVEPPELRDRLADAVYEPANVRGAALVVALVGRSGFDVGRAAQNMMLAAWNEGVASCPNGLRDGERARDLLGLAPGDALGTVLSFGFPARPRDPESRPPAHWSAQANRKPLGALVERL
jgi:nitroreductase